VVDELPAMANAELVEDGAEVGADGVDADAEVGGDLLIAEAVGGEPGAAELRLSEEMERQAFLGIGDAADADANVGRLGVLGGDDDGEGGLEAFDGRMAADGLQGLGGEGRVWERSGEAGPEALQEAGSLLEDFRGKRQRVGFPGLDERGGAAAAPPGAGFGGGGVVEDDLFPGIEEDDALHGMIEGLLEHLNERLAGVEKTDSMDGVVEVGVELLQQGAFGGSEGSLEGGAVEADMGDEVVVRAPEKEGGDMADAVRLHDLAIEGGGEEFLGGHLVIQESGAEAGVISDEPGHGRLGIFQAQAIGMHVIHLDGGAEGHGGEPFVGQRGDEIVDGKGGVDEVNQGGPEGVEVESGMEIEERASQRGVEG
jgi:hypothetical protein